MTRAEIRHQIHMQEVEKKLKLVRMNWFIKNYETIAANTDKPKTITSPKMEELVKEIYKMRAKAKDMYAKLDDYQNKLNTKASDLQDNDITLVTEPMSTTNMYPIPSDVELQLYNGI